MIQIRLMLKDEMSASLNKAGGGLKDLSRNLTSVGTQMTAAFTLPILAAGAAGLKLASDLDKSMRNIQSITKQTDESLAGLSDEFVSLSMDMKKTTDSAENLADAYYTVIGSNIDAADAMGVLEAATKAATAGLTETEVAAKGMLATMNAYGLEAAEATRISDLMFETVNRGVGSFEDLSSAMGSVVGSASSLNIAEEELFASIATLSKQGQSFETATTNINAALTSLIAPTTAMKKAFSDLGYESGSAMIEALGFAGTMQKLAEYTGGSQEAMQALFGDVRSMRAALGLTGKAADMFAEDLAAMGASTGATEAAFAEQMKSFDASFKNFTNTVNALLIDIGQTMMPVLSAIMNAITPILHAFMALPEPVKQFIIVLLGLIAVAGPLLIIIGQIVGAISAIGAIMPVVSAAFAGFLALGAPVIALIGLIIAAIVLLIANWQNLGQTVGQIGTLIVEGWKGIFSSIGTTLSQLGQLIWNALNQITGGMFQLGVNIIMGLMKGIASKAVDLIAYVFGLSKELTATIKHALGIASPSKVMMDIGKNVVAGFHEGIASMGGVGVNVPQVSSGGSSNPSLSYAGASAGGGGNVYIENMNMPAGTTQQQIDHFNKELARQSKIRGGKK